MVWCTIMVTWCVFVVHPHACTCVAPSCVCGAPLCVCVWCTLLRALVVHHHACVSGAPSCVCKRCGAPSWLRGARSCVCVWSSWTHRLDGVHRLVFDVHLAHQKVVAVVVNVQRLQRAIEESQIFRFVFKPGAWGERRCRQRGRGSWI